MKSKALVNYQGRVQGVGFRFTTYELAKRYQVSGYVKNLPDSSVELVAEGEEDELQKFFDSILKSPVGHFIQRHTIDWREADSAFSDFQIRF